MPGSVSHVRPVARGCAGPPTRSCVACSARMGIRADRPLQRGHWGSPGAVEPRASVSGREITSSAVPMDNRGRRPEMHETTTAGDAVVLVEGQRDRYAEETLARRGGRVLAMNGASFIGHFLDRYGPRGLDVRLAGLFDAAEEGCFRRGLERAGLGPGDSRAGME